MSASLTLHQMAPATHLLLNSNTLPSIKYYSSTSTFDHIQIKKGKTCYFLFCFQLGGQTMDKCCLQITTKHCLSLEQWAVLTLANGRCLLHVWACLDRRERADRRQWLSRQVMTTTITIITTTITRIWTNSNWAAGRDRARGRLNTSSRSVVVSDSCALILNVCAKVTSQYIQCLRNYV